MIRTISDFYSYLFQEEEDVTTAYFKSRTDTAYRVYFYPAMEYFDRLHENDLLYKFGYFFGFTKLAPNENKVEPLDCRVRNTILVIINEFFEEKGVDKVLIFYCDNDDGKKSKRSICFENWYGLSETKTCFKKYDEEIVITGENGERIDVDYMSLIIECENPNIDPILIEFQSLKEQFIASK